MFLDSVGPLVESGRGLRSRKGCVTDGDWGTPPFPLSLSHLPSCDLNNVFHYRSYKSPLLFEAGHRASVTV